MRLTRKLSRNLLYALLLTLTCIIVRDSIIILNARYGLFLHQNIFLRNFPDEKQRDTHFDSKGPVYENKRTVFDIKRKQENTFDKESLPKDKRAPRNSYFIDNHQEKSLMEKQKFKEKDTSARKKTKKEQKGLQVKESDQQSRKRARAKAKEDELKDINALLDYLKRSSFQSDPTGNEKKYKMCLLLAYPRSGSSFVGQVLSAYNHTLYMFEPLFLLIKKTYELVDTEIVPVFLDKIFTCDPVTMGFLRKKLFVVKSKNELCETAKLMLMKTIRLRLRVAMEWLQLNPHIKVVHLVRDPRGIVASMKKGPFREKNATIQCQHLREDYMYGKQLQKNRYMRVKYEDLVDHSLKNFKKVFTFMGLPYNDDVKHSVLLHTQAEKLQENNKEEQPKIFKIGTYYSLYRFSKFQHDHTWKKLSTKAVTEIEIECQDIMKELKYNPLYVK